MKMRIINILYYVGALTMLSALCIRFFFIGMFPYVYIAGAILFAITRFLLRPKVEAAVLKRLILQQQLAGLLFVASAVLCFTHARNEWIVLLSIAAVLELYTAFRIPQEYNK